MHGRNTALWLFIALAFLAVRNPYARPAFSSPYGMSCTACPVGFPKPMILAQPSRTEPRLERRERRRPPDVVRVEKTGNKR